ncbi:anti-sigma factor [Gordonia sp. ABSL1-1]|uniref:ATP-binding protein n=1 Tax=Gordonia sp. ABSL1-1 TaxID=3053923 RepID=UPI0025740345|nr:anti-sigma factor [Gordonia sp. ABSL1-1]MDL9935265.1 anti-sigma factor [Gordonia sp. ABSL1-1]
MTDQGDTIDEQLVEVTHAAGPPVQVSVAAEADRLSIVRAVVERTLFLADWPLDDVADIQLAVDEVCSQLVTISAAGHRIDVSLSVGPHGLLAVIDGRVADRLQLDTTGFGWRVVETVTDRQSVTYDDSRPEDEHTESDRRVTVRITKRVDV